MYRFQLNHNSLETRPYPISADKKGNIIGIWQKHYRKVIGFSCFPRTGCVDVTFEQFTETKQSLKGMYAVMECADGAKINQDTQAVSIWQGFIRRKILQANMRMCL